MKKFIFEIAIVAFATVSICILVRLYWINCFPNKIAPPYSEGTTTLVLGASSSECAINDSILSTYLNLSESSLYFCANYNSLIWFDKHSKNSIDTVLCSAGLVSFLYYDPNVPVSFPARVHKTERYSMYSYDEYLNLFTKNKLEALWNFLFSLKITDFSISRIGGHYEQVFREKINDPRAKEAIQKKADEYGYSGYTEEVLRRDAREQAYFLRKMKEYCDEHSIVFILFNPPYYKISDFISNKGYKEYLLHEFGDDLLIADYEHFVFPDLSYYGDYEHLNYKGSCYLSEWIKKKGLELITAKDYCKTT